MAKNIESAKLIIVESGGTISELGGISGPILNPCYIPIKTINTMLTHHRVVYEVNPNNYQEKIRLTLRNLRTENFVKNTVNTKAHVAPSESKSSTKVTNVTENKKSVGEPLNKNTQEKPPEKTTDTTTPTMDFTKK